MATHKVFGLFYSKLREWDAIYHKNTCVPSVVNAADLNKAEPGVGHPQKKIRTGVVWSKLVAPKYFYVCGNSFERGQSKTWLSDLTNGSKNY